MKKLTLLIALALFLAALLLRLDKYEYHAAFDWDQNRDYGQVEKITRGDLVVLGPVAKGVGGFYLGSLYYYLLVPAYTLMHHSLSALPMTSIIFDALACALIYFLLARYTGRYVAFGASALWTFSWLMIGASRVSWNVALIPLWSVATLSLILSLHRSPRPKLLYLLALIGGFAVHIHVSAILLVPILVLLFLRRQFTPKQFLVSGLIYLLPTVPLIIFDLTHGLKNLHLFLFQFKSQAAAPVGLLPMLQMTVLKLGKVVSGIFTAHYAVNFWIGILTLVLAAAALRSKLPYLKLAGTISLFAIIQILLLHDYHFPEYYFAIAYLPLILLYLGTIRLLFSRLPLISGPLVLVIVLGLCLINYRATSQAAPSGYSLGIKRDLIRSLHELPEPIDLSFQVDQGREGGFDYLVKLEGIKLDPASKYRVIITDKVSYPAYIDGELASDQVQLGDLKSALYIVQ